MLAWLSLHGAELTLQRPRLHASPRKTHLAPSGTGLPPKKHSTSVVRHTAGSAAVAGTSLAGMAMRTLDAPVAGRRSAFADAAMVKATRRR